MSQSTVITVSDTQPNIHKEVWPHIRCQTCLPRTCLSLNKGHMRTASLSLPASVFPHSKSLKRQKKSHLPVGPNSPVIPEIIHQYLWSTRSDREKGEKSAEIQASRQIHQPGRSQPRSHVIARLCFCTHRKDNTGCLREMKDGWHQRRRLAPPWKLGNELT